MDRIPKLVVLAVLISFAFPAFASAEICEASSGHLCWYVDTSSQGTADGRSWANARAFSNIDTLPVGPGDILYLNGGPSGSTRTYSGVSGWTPRADWGTASNKVTYTVGQDEGHNGNVIFEGGGAQAWLSGQLSNFNIIGDAGDGQSHIKVQNYGIGAYSLSASPTNIRLAYIYYNNLPGGAVDFMGGSNIEIDNSYIHKTYGASYQGYSNAIFIYGGTNLRIHDNTIYFPRGGAEGCGDNGIAGFPSNTYIYNNQLIAYVASGYPACSTGYQPTCDGIHLTGGNVVRIYNNTITDAARQGIFFDGFNNFIDIIVYNNVARLADSALRSFASYKAGVAVFPPVSSTTNIRYKDILIANNMIDGYSSISNPGMRFSIDMRSLGTPTSFENCQLRNNAIVNSAAISSDSAVVTSNNTDISSSQAPSQFESWTLNGANDYHLKSGSILIDSGMSLQSHFITDADGVIRPQGSAWDVGPYEYVVSGPTNGTCGTASGKTYAQGESFPGNYSLCSAGTPNPPSPTLDSTSGSTTTWYCQGSDGGATATCTASRYAVPTAGLVGYWALDDGSGTTAIDSSGNGNNGMLSGPTWTTGKIGGALSFDGSADEVYTPLSVPNNSFTFGAWVKATTTHEIDNQTTNSCNSNANCDGALGQHYAFEATYKGGANVGAGLSIGTNGISVYECGEGYMPATLVYSADIGTGWNHIMVVYNNKQPTLYINGIAVKTGLTSPKSAIYAPKDFGCGLFGCFSGTMDEVRIYDRALSASEVQQVYQYGIPTSMNHHSADTDKNWALETPEVSTYNLCWKTPTCIPSPPTTYVSNANLMWKSRADGAYHYNSTNACPLCWSSGP